MIGIRKSTHQQGFTVVEVLITIVVISIIIAVSSATIKLLIRANDTAVDTSSVSIIAQNKIESLRNQDYASIASHPFTDELPKDLPFPRSASADVTEYPIGLKRVRINISYGGYTQVYTTLISETSTDAP